MMGPSHPGGQRIGSRSVHRPCKPSRRGRALRGRADAGALRALREPDLPLLPPPARLARGGRGRRPKHVPERLPGPSARRRPRARVGMALQDRPQRLPLAAAVVVAARPDRVARGLRAGRGADTGAGAARRGADRTAGRARADAGEPAPGNPAARVAGPLVSRDRRGARRDPGSRGDAHLPGAPHARDRPGTAAAACTSGLPRGRPREPPCRAQGAPPRRRRRAQGCGHGRRRRRRVRGRRGTGLPPPRRAGEAEARHAATPRAHAPGSFGDPGRPAGRARARPCRAGRPARARLPARPARGQAGAAARPRQAPCAGRRCGHRQLG